MASSEGCRPRDDSSRWESWLTRQTETGPIRPRKFCHVRAFYGPSPQGHAVGQSRGTAVQPRIHRDGAHSAGIDQGRQRGGGQRAEEPRCRPAQDPAGGREARPERTRHGHDGQASPNSAGEEGHRVRDGRGPKPQPQLRGDGAHSARPAARAGRRGGPGADEPGPEARRRPRRGAQSAGSRRWKGKPARRGPADLAQPRASPNAAASRRRPRWTASAAT